jgi:hydrophobe/amphiphile efflux-1 (HAE1) family protein
MANFFIDRPVFAWVVAIGMMLAGVLAIYNLPISQYPSIAPPSISIRGVYPGASAQAVEDSVTQIIEQQMTGLDRMLYISSTSDASGMASIELTFSPGTDPDLAWAKVQNKLQLAMPVLPEAVQRQGLRVSKSTRNYLLIIGLTSLDNSLDQDDLADYCISTIQYSLARVPGVGEVEAMGSGYAMRIWVDPKMLTNYSLTPADVITGVRSYNVQVSAGQLGGAPAVPGQRLNAPIIVQTLLKTPEEFGNIPLRNNPDGSVVRVRDVARVELGSEFSQVKVDYMGHPMAALAIRQEAGANALDTAAGIKTKMEELSRFFPAGMQVVYPYDTTPFVRVAINEVVKTLIEAIFLVFLVMFLFLGNMRATLIPTIAVPVVILGTFGVLGLFGYSINMLTMFAMVLAIGLLVDDAIVVVENVERVMSETGLSPREATRKSMGEITSALVGIGMVLAAVFCPMIFFGGTTGIIYRQFSITIISSMLLSVLVALILTPVLCASLLRPMGKGHEAAETGSRLLRPFFLWFDHLFLRLRGKYYSAVAHIFRAKLRYIAVFVLIVAVAGYLYLKMPTSYLPDEDQGNLLIMAQLPSGSTLEQTRGIMDKVRDHFVVDEKEAVESCMTIAGFGMSGMAQNQGMGYVKLRDWDLRGQPNLKVGNVIERATISLAQIRGATIYTLAPPAIMELSTSRGIDFMLQDRGAIGHEKLMEARLMLMGLGNRDPRIKYVRPNGLDDVAEYKVDIDWEKAGTLGISVPVIQNSISVAFGSAYINDFIKGGRVHRAYVQADAPYRMLPEDLNNLYVRNTKGSMVPVSAVTSGRWIYDSPRLERFNGFPALNFQGEPATGKSTGDAMKAMEEIAGKLGSGIGYEWTGLSYQEKLSQTQTGLLYGFSVLAIFLVLAALYESWSIPISILLALPLGVIGGVLFSSSRGLSNDVYFQIGLLTVLGLTTKNAILIVQFAKIRLEQGAGLIEATLEGAKLRLRPILMTSLAFGFGVLPLAIATGAGAGAQKAIGTSVLGGMITATFLAIFFIPLFFVLITQIFGRKKFGDRATAVASGSEIQTGGAQNA